MGIYDMLSFVLTLVGTFVLLYRTVNELDSASKLSRREKLCTKWVIFMIFLKLEYVILAVLEIIPLGALALLVIKFLLFMPENPISHKIYKTIQKKLERIKMDEYHSYVGVYLSMGCKITVVALIKTIKKIAEYVNSHDIEQIEVVIMDILKALEYKKAAVNMRHSTIKSQVNKELDDSDFNSSTDQEGILINLPPQEKPKKNLGANKQLSKLLLSEIDDENNPDILKARVELMIVKPNKTRNQKAKYEETTVQMYLSTRKITFTNLNKAVEQGTLKEVKWITKNMINIEMVLEEGRSKVIKLIQKEDVARFVEPICARLEVKG